MKTIYRLLGGMVLLCAVALGGCAQLQTFESKVSNAYATLTQAKVDGRYALVAAEAFNTLETAGKNYLKLPRCGSASATVVCRDPKVTRQIVAAFQAGRVARDAVIGWVRDNPCDPAGLCPLMPKSLYDTLSSTVDTLKSIYSTYNVNL